MEIRYQIFEKEMLLVQKFIGDFSIEFYMRYNRYIMENPESKAINKVLIDFREIRFDDIPDDFDDVLDSEHPLWQACQCREFQAMVLSR